MTRQPSCDDSGLPGTAARNAARHRVLKEGVIGFNQLGSTMPCAVRDFSNVGARLILEVGMTPPDTFDLIVKLDGVEVSCVVKWRRGREIGVAFVSEVRASAYHRKQSLIPTRPEPKPTLRRKPASR
ncbi:MAG: PilZ domain-containing protein [Hyphomicrobium sp.]